MTDQDVSTVVVAILNKASHLTMSTRENLEKQHPNEARDSFRHHSALQSVDSPMNCMTAPRSQWVISFANFSSMLVDHVMVVVLSWELIEKARDIKGSLMRLGRNERKCPMCVILKRRRCAILVDSIEFSRMIESVRYLLGLRTSIVLDEEKSEPVWIR